MLISSKQNKYKTWITACLDELKHEHSQVTAFNHETFWGVFPWDCIVAETPLVWPQSSLPQHNLPVQQSGWQVCDGEASTTLAHIGAVLSLKGGIYSKD